MKAKGLIVTLVLMCLLCIVPVRVQALNNVSNNNYTYILADPTTTASSSDELVKKYNVCEENDIKNFVDTYWKVLVIAAPGLLIMMISIDFFKAVMSSDEDLIKKASTNAIKRTAAMIILLMLPYILRMIFSWAGLDFCL